MTITKHLIKTQIMRKMEINLALKQSHTFSMNKLNQDLLFSSGFGN